MCIFKEMCFIAFCNILFWHNKFNTQLCLWGKPWAARYSIHYNLDIIEYIKSTNPAHLSNLDIILNLMKSSMNILPFLHSVCMTVWYIMKICWSKRDDAYYTYDAIFQNGKRWPATQSYVSIRLLLMIM